MILAFWMLLSPDARAAQFEERALLLSGVAQPRSMPTCDVWTRTSGDQPPLLLCHYPTGGLGEQFVFWRLGADLRDSAEVVPALAFSPSGSLTGAGRVRFCLARLTPAAPPSLLFATPGGVVAFRGDSGRILDTREPVRLAEAGLPGGPSAPSRLTARELADRVAPMAFALDIDGDDRDELILPEDDGWAIWAGEGQARDRRIELPRVPLTPQFEYRVDGGETEGGRGLTPRRGLVFSRGEGSALWLIDVDRDGRLDVALTRLANRDAPPRATADDAGGASSDATPHRLDVFLQRDDGAFETSPAQTVFFDEKPVRRLWKDLDADGRLDLVEMRGNYDLVAPLMLIDLFRAEDAVTNLRGARPWRRFPARNPAGLALFGDWDGDGDIDMARTHFDYTFGSASDMAEMIFGKDMKVKVFFYRYDRGFSATPAVSLQVEFKTECLQRYRGEALLQVAPDLTGDGHPDLLLRSAPDTLQLHGLNLARGRVDRAPSHEFRIPEWAEPRADDLDADGKADLWWLDPKESRVSVRLQR